MGAFPDNPYLCIRKKPMIMKQDPRHIHISEFNYPLPDEAQETALFKNKIEISIIPDYYYRDLQEG